MINIRNVLQTAATTGQQSVAAADPNMFTAATPLGTAPATAAPGVPTVMGPSMEKESFVDEWAKVPDQAPPVRTWVDPTQRTAGNGEFLAAWYDTSIPGLMPAHFNDATAAMNEAVIKDKVAKATPPKPELPANAGGFFVPESGGEGPGGNDGSSDGGGEGGDGGSDGGGEGGGPGDGGGGDGGDGGTY